MSSQNDPPILGGLEPCQVILRRLSDKELQEIEKLNAAVSVQLLNRNGGHSFIK